MRAVASLFSFRHFLVSLALISTFTSAYAIPVQSDCITLNRRNVVNVGDKAAVLGKQLTKPDKIKSSVHQLTSWDGHANPGHVIKTYKNEKKVTDREVESLKAVGQYVHHDGSHVVMKEVKGRLLSDLMKGQPHDERTKIKKQYRPQVQKLAADIAKTHGMLHTDIHPENVIIHPEGHVQLVDWEHYIKKGESGFTDDEKGVKAEMSAVWTSSDPSKKKSGSPKRRSLSRREVFYYADS